MPGTKRRRSLCSVTYEFLSWVMSTDFYIWVGYDILFLTELDCDAVLFTPFLERERGRVGYLVVAGMIGSSWVFLSRRGLTWLFDKSSGISIWSFLTADSVLSSVLVFVVFVPLDWLLFMLIFIGGMGKEPEVFELLDFLAKAGSPAAVVVCAPLASIISFSTTNKLLSFSSLCPWIIGTPTRCAFPWDVFGA